MSKHVVPRPENIIIAAMIKGHAAEILSQGITVDLFYQIDARIAFTAIKRLFDSGVEITYETVGAEFNAEKAEADIPESQESSDTYIETLPHSGVDMWQSSVNLARVKKSQRDQVSAAEELIRKLDRPATCQHELKSRISEPLAALTDFSVSDDGITLKERAEALRQRKRDEAAGKVEKLPDEFRLLMGMPKLEDIIVPVDVRARDNNIIIGAPSSAGKSALTRQILAANLKGHDNWVIVGFLLESDAEDFMHNAACSHVGINTVCPHDRVPGPKQKAYDEYIGWISEQADERLFLFDSSHTIDEITTRLNEIKAKTGRIDLIAVDYLQIVDRDGSGANQEVQIATISRGIQKIQKLFKCPCLSGTQLNEQGQTRESRAVFNDATRIWLLRRPENDPQGGRQDDGLDSYYTIFEQAKSRSGPRVTSAFTFQVTTQIMKDLI